MISVHLTTHKRYESGLLERSIESILGQTFSDFELVVCDDASRDGSGEYVDRVAATDSRVRVVRNDRNVNSVAISLGRCFEAADPSRPLVTWMFDDCILAPHAFERLAAAMAGDDRPDFAFGITAVHNRSGGTARLVGGASEAAIREGIDRSAVLVPNAALAVRRDLFDQIGWYDPNVLLRRSCDWDLFRRAIRAGARFTTLGEVLCEEWGEQLPDSLRNGFTTSFELMSKYVALRDEAAWDLSLDAALHHPVDRIPYGSWSPDEFRLCLYIMLEYFLAVNDLTGASVWARRLAAQLDALPFYAANLESLGAGDTAALGAYCGMVWGAYRASVPAGSVGALAAANGRNGRPAPMAVQRLATTLAGYPRLYPAAQRAWHAIRPSVVRPAR